MSASAVPAASLTLPTSRARAASETDSPWLSDEQQRVWRQWLAASAFLPSAMAKQLHDDAGLSLQDFTVLVRLSEAEQSRMRMAVLATSVDWDRSRLSHHVARMEKRGLVQRESCEQDGRGAYVVLLPEGRQRLETAAPGHARLVRRLMFEPLDADSFRALDELTRGLLERLVGQAS